MTTQIERFTTASRTLADIRHVPAGRGLWQQQYDTGPCSRVTIGTMLAQVAIVPAAGARCTLIAVGGDPEMLDALKARPDGQGIVIEGELPFKPGSTGGVFGNVTITGGVTMVSGSGAVYSSSGSGPSVIINGREVDLSRDVRLVLMVPAAASIRIRGFMGAAGITGDLGGDLDFSPSFFAALAAPGRIRSLTADLSGSGRAVSGRVEDDTDLEISGSGGFRIGAACGAVATKISGSGSVTIGGGTSTSLRASVSGSGSISHEGVTSGNARLKVSGSGRVHAADVRGDVDPKVTGSGSISVNGRTYRPRW